MKKIKIFKYVLTPAFLFYPFISFGADRYVAGEGLVPKCGEVVNGVIENPCNFDRLIDMINKVINFIIIDMATPVFAIIIIYVGFLYLTSGASKGNKDKAKKIAKNALLGYVLILAAWLIVKTILNFVDYNGPSYLSLINSVIS